MLTARVKRVKTHLEPFTIATLVLQAPDAKLSAVPLTLGNLYRIFSDPNVEPRVRSVVHDSLEKRWAKADQDVFIASLLMNPYIRGRSFASGSSFLTPAGLYAIVRRVYERVMRVPAGLELHQAFRDYMVNANEFSPEDMMLSDMKAMYEAAVSSYKVQQNVANSACCCCRVNRWILLKCGGALITAKQLAAIH